MGRDEKEGSMIGKRHGGRDPLPFLLSPTNYLAGPFSKAETVAHLAVKADCIGVLIQNTEYTLI